MTYFKTWGSITEEEMKRGPLGVPAVCEYGWLYCQVSLVQAFWSRKKGTWIKPPLCTKCGEQWNIKRAHPWNFLADQDETCTSIILSNNLTDISRCLWVQCFHRLTLWLSMTKFTVLEMNNVDCICICQCILRCNMEMSKLADVLKMQASF